MGKREKISLETRDHLHKNQPDSKNMKHTAYLISDQKAQSPVHCSANRKERRPLLVRKEYPHIYPP